MTINNLLRMDPPQTKNMCALRTALPSGSTHKEALIPKNKGSVTHKGAPVHNCARGLLLVL